MICDGSKDQPSSLGLTVLGTEGATASLLSCLASNKTSYAGGSLGRSRTSSYVGSLSSDSETGKQCNL